MTIKILNPIMSVSILKKKLKINNIRIGRIIQELNGFNNNKISKKSKSVVKFNYNNYYKPLNLSSVKWNYKPEGF